MHGAVKSKSVKCVDQEAGGVIAWSLRVTASSPQAAQEGSSLYFFEIDVCKEQSVLLMWIVDIHVYWSWM